MRKTKIRPKYTAGLLYPHRKAVHLLQGLNVLLTRLCEPTCVDRHMPCQVVVGIKDLPTLGAWKGLLLAIIGRVGTIGFPALTRRSWPVHTRCVTYCGWSLRSCSLLPC